MINENMELRNKINSELLKKRNSSVKTLQPPKGFQEVER